MHKILPVLLLVATTALAQQPAAREPFPSDYTPSPCAPEAKICQSFPMDQMSTAAYTFRGLALTEDWMNKYSKEVTASFAPTCKKLATCYTMQGSTFAFCNDTVMPELRSKCDRFDKGTKDYEQCTIFVETYGLGFDQRSRAVWEDAQACMKTQPAAEHHAPIVWVEPSPIPRHYKGRVTFYVIDPDVRVPLNAVVKVEDQTIWTSINPLGVPGAYYPFTWPYKLNRVKNADGHRDVVAPKVTIVSEGYPDVVMTMPVDVSKMKVTLEPSIDQLKSGKNTVKATAIDEETGKPVEARVMLGSQIAGYANQEPFTIEIAKGKGAKRPEIWAESLFGDYSDVVIAPAAK